MKSKYIDKLLVILGPTSTGKTDLALNLAKKFNGEMVACDSRQVYTGLDIGTGKLPGGKWTTEDGRWRKGKGWWEIDDVKIWMYDVADPKKQYTVYDYVKEAHKVIDSILKRGRLPIIVGGSGLYLKALLDGLTNLAIPIDQKLRKKLEKLSLIELQEELHKLSPQKWEGMNTSDRQNPRRLVRSIEIIQTKTPRQAFISATAVELMLLKIGLTAPREILYQRIDERVISRINQEMVDEAKKLHQSGLTFKRMRQLGLEYGVLADYLEDKIKSKEELVKRLQGKIHDYARRQITWFKKTCLSVGREKNVLWFDITGTDWLEQMESRVNSWYHATYDQKN